MANRTVLEYVQKCLNTLDSDAVTSISDTEEAMQVAEMLEDVFLELMNREEWPHLKGAIALTAAASTSLPTKFTIPEAVSYVKTLKYNIDYDGGFQPKDLEYVEPEEFLTRRGAGNNADNVQLCTVSSNIQFYVLNDNDPSYYTSFDNDTIFMDAFRSDEETYLSATRLIGFGVTVPTFTVSDSFIPEIPKHMIPLLQSTLNAKASLDFKQIESPGDEKRVLRQIQAARRKSSKVNRKNYYASRNGRK